MCLVRNTEIEVSLSHLTRGSIHVTRSKTPDRRNAARQTQGGRILCLLQAGPAAHALALEHLAGADGGILIFEAAEAGAE